MIPALMLGRGGSIGFPGKNVHRVLGRPLMAYPLMAARGSRWIGRIFVSTDAPKIKAVASDYGVTIIERPTKLATKQALGEDAFAHGYQTIKAALANEGQKIELLVLLFCNGATITSELIDEGIRVLRSREEFDSAVSVSCYNMWSPLRARRIGPDGLLHPFVPFGTFGDPATLTCDRDSQGDVYFADMGVSIVRPRCFDHLQDGQLPQRWMGRRIYPLKQWGGFDVDYAWQIPQVEYWLKAHGVVRASETQRARLSTRRARRRTPRQVGVVQR